jgi:hypothetical protein
VLVRDGARLALGPAASRTDGRFAGVADIVAYQAAFHAETVAALRRQGASTTEPNDAATER